MSLVRRVDSTTSYHEPTLYGGKGSINESNLSNLPNQAFRSDRQVFMYRPTTYHSDYNQMCVSSSSGQLVELVQPNLSSISDNSHIPFPPYQQMSNSGSSRDSQYSACLVAAKQSSLFPCVSQHSSESTTSRSPENEMFYRNEIRSKLEELERELLNDNDDGSLLWEGDPLDIDDDGWVEPMKNLLVPDSPMESSSDSNLTGVDNAKEIKTPKQLLFDCATFVSEGKNEEASFIISELRKIVSIQGDPSQRIAAYMVEGLAARLASSGQGLYKALKCKEPPTSDRLSAMQILFEICPCFKFGFMAANGAILDAFKDEKRVHIIDFDINQGNQYIALLQDLAKYTSKPYLKVTGVDDPESVQRAVGGLKIIGLRLKELARILHIPFEFQTVAAKTRDVTPAMFECQQGEALIVNFAYQLHHMPDESVSTVNQRDQLLRMVKGLGPKLVTVVEQDINANTAPFFPRFVEVYNYYQAIFESLDATMSRDSPDRMNVERQCLARDIVNIVACEGEDRIERYEAAGKWRARMTMAGFISSSFSSSVSKAIRSQVKEYCDRYKVKEEAGALHFGWEDKILIAASAWR